MVVGTDVGQTAQGGRSGSLASYLLDHATAGMLRLLVVAGSAFVLAALTQRLVLGAFAFEAAGFKLPAEGATKEALHETVRLLERHRIEVLDEMADRTTTTGKGLRDLGARLAVVEATVAGLAPPEPGTMASSRRDDQSAEEKGER